MGRVQAYRRLWLGLAVQVPELQQLYLTGMGRSNRRSGSFGHSPGSSQQLPSINHALNHT